MDLLKDLEGTGFLREYVANAVRLSDAPEEFHIFCTLAALGAAASRVRVPFGSSTMAPNLWLVLAAPSAFYRKTTAMELARRLLFEACPAAAPPTLYRASRLMQSLAGVNQLLAVDDFSWLLAGEARDRLIELYDGGRPLSLVSTISTAALARCLCAADLAAGFLPRFSLVVAKEKNHWLGLPGRREAAAERPLVNFLRQAGRLEGTASLTDCYGRLRDWSQHMAQWASDMGGHAGHRATALGMASRLELTVLKLATLIEIARSGSLRVSSASFLAAQSLTGFLRVSFGRLLTQELRAANEFQHELRVIASVSRAPGITRRRLQRNSHMDALTFGRVLAALQRNGRVSRNGRRFFPADPLSNTLAFAKKSANAYPVEASEVNA